MNVPSHGIHGDDILYNLESEHEVFDIDDEGMDSDTITGLSIDIDDVVDNDDETVIIDYSDSDDSYTEVFGTDVNVELDDTAADDSSTLRWILITFLNIVSHFRISRSAASVILSLFSFVLGMVIWLLNSYNIIIIVCLFMQDYFHIHLTPSFPRMYVKQ